MSGVTARHFVALDGLRGVAALLVIFFHVPWPWPFSTHTAVRNFYLMVDLFFLLSGFVIHHAYHNRLRTTADIAHFLLRRTFRLLPLYVFLFAIFVSLERLQGKASPNWNPPAWSLAAEFIAYGFYAFAMRLRYDQRPHLRIITIIVAVAVYAFIAMSENTLDVTGGLGALRAVSGFIIGAALYSASKPDAAMAEAFQVASMAAIVLILSCAEGGSVLFVLPCFATLIWGLSPGCGLLANLLCRRGFQFMGAVSFSVYLLHYPIILQLSPHLLFMTPEAGVFVTVGFLAAVVALASLTFKWIELPFQKMGRDLSLKVMQRRLEKNGLC